MFRSFDAASRSAYASRVVLSAEHLLFLYLTKMSGYQRSVPEYAINRIAERFLIGASKPNSRVKYSTQAHCRLGEAQAAMLLTMAAWRVDLQ